MFRLFNVPMEALLDDIEKGESFFEPFVTSRPRVEKKGSEYLVEIDLPGVKREDIEIEVDGGALRIAGKRGDQKIERSVSLAEGADVEAIEARSEDGVLYIRIPLNSRTKKIEVK